MAATVSASVTDCPPSQSPSVTDSASDCEGDSTSEIDPVPPERSEAPRCDCVSQKCCEFTCNPMSGKQIEQVPGIGRTYGCRLRKAGICKAKDLLDVFLSFARGAEFCAWLSYTAGSNMDYAEQTYQCLKQWCRKFMPRARCSDDEEENDEEKEDSGSDSDDSQKGKKIR